MAPKAPRGSAERKLFTFALILVLSSFFMMGLFSRTMKSAEDDQFWEFTAMFSEIYKEVKERYVEEADSKKLFEGALQGMFLTLDPHSQYMDPDNYSQLEKDTEGAFSGVGIQIQIRDGVLTVITPIPGSPAAKAGLRPWDRIIEIEGKDTKGINLPDAVRKLTGPSGTTVKITVYREGEPDLLHFELVRKSIKVESIYSHMLDNQIGYARITKFSDNTARDLRKAVEEFKAKNAKGIIVDLRYNSGGLLKEAVDVSNVFLPKGKLIVSTKGRIPNQNAEYKATNDQFTDLPLIVLINKGSASASEIFAGAIKDHNRGVVLGIKGQRSFGKGSVQTIEELTHSFEKDPNGNYRPAAIRLTTARYYMPLGESIDKVGVTPDIAVELPKGHQEELLKHGLYGDPETEEEDVVSTKSQFTWEKYGKNGSTAPATTETKEVSSTPDPQGDDDNIVTNAIKGKDDSTTGPQPRKIIPVDRTIFPNAEIEEPKKPDLKKKVPNEKFVDYQLETAKRLMSDLLDKGMDFFSADSGMPKNPEGANKEVAAKPTEGKAGI
ncbi:MAG: S41 family peptidase [Candidatus Sumerlaeaceae bacterium]|nr:S41 family peptidase [Candidatus Sumerlaeaceae bacterium]